MAIDQSQLTLTDITRMSDDELREERLYAAVATAQMLADGLEAHARARAEVFATMTAELDHRSNTQGEDTMSTITKPHWADTEHSEAGGYTWSRETLEHHGSDGMDYVPGVTLFCSVGLHSAEGTVSVKQDDPLIYVGGDPITPETARRVRDGLTEALRLLDE